MEQFHVEASFDIVPRFNIAPTQQIASISRDESGKRQLAFRHWGLIPSWSKDSSMGARMINARSETVPEKPAFRAAFKRRRCLIPVDGYYEWKAVGKKKQPYLFHLENDGLFAFAGLWEVWHAANGSSLESCTIITTAADERASHIHDRMPVLVLPQDYDAWLDVSSADTKRAQELIGSSAPLPIVAVAVSTYVSNARDEGPECVQGIE